MPVSDSSLMEFEAKSARDGAWLVLGAFSFSNDIRIENHVNNCRHTYMVQTLP